MAKIPIWPGSSSFNAGDTAFGFYDSDLDFQSDAPNIAKWCAQRLGYPLVDVELQSGSFYTAFEEAVTEYGHQVYTFQIINNLFRVLGESTASALNQIELSTYYGQSSVGGGGSANQGSGTSYNITDDRLFTASLQVKAGQQRYNLLSNDPEYQSSTITFSNSASVSESIRIIDPVGNDIEFVAHRSYSDFQTDSETGELQDLGYHVSTSLYQFETGSTITETLQNLVGVIDSSSIYLSASINGSILTLTSNVEGSGYEEIRSTTLPVTTSSFTGGSSGLSFEQSGSSIQAGTKTIKIKKIYHHAPAAINRYFDPYAGTGTGIQSLMQTFGFGNYSPGVNFMLMPVYFDALKLQAIEFNDSIRKSAYHFDLNAGQFLRLFPIPTRDYTLWFEYTMADSTNSPTTTTGPTGELIDSPTDGVTDMSNVPYDRPTYAYINEPGRQWIRKYTLALAKEMLGGIRGKYQQLPIPGSETTLDYSRLLDEARNEKEALIIQLREDLESTTTLRQKERSAAESEQTQIGYSLDNPYQIYIH